MKLAVAIQCDVTVYEIGDRIQLTSLDYRWYTRLWYYITFRYPPIVEENKVVIDITSDMLILKKDKT